MSGLIGYVTKVIAICSHHLNLKVLNRFLAGKVS